MYIYQVEVSNICSLKCSYCPHPKQERKKGFMSFDTFKQIFHRLPRNLTQIAFGLGTLSECPEFWKMAIYCRSNDYNFVVPNITINGDSLTDEQANNLVDLCGAVSVSCYEPEDICYDAVEKLTKYGLKQTNIHALVAEQTYEKCMQVMKDSQTDPRLKDLNAIVFLALKPKGKRNDFTSISTEHYTNIINYALENNIRVGFDSCSACAFNKITKDKFQEYAEPCESYLMSLYISVDGKSVPCSFLEGEEGYTELDVLNCQDFIKDIWNSKAAKEWRTKLLANGRRCPHFNVLNGL